MNRKRNITNRKKKRRKIDNIKAQMRKQFASMMSNGWSQAVCPELVDDIMPPGVMKAGSRQDITEVFKNIYISNQETAQNISELTKRDIGLVICLIGELGEYNYDIYKKNGIEIVHIKIKDSSKENISVYFDRMNKLIEKYTSLGTPILVHCQAGVSRSTTIVVSYLMGKYDYDYKKSIEIIREKRSFVQPNFGFMDQLEKYYGKPVLL